MSNFKTSLGYLKTLIFFQIPRGLFVLETPKIGKCLHPVGAFSGITLDGKKIVAGTLRCNSWTCPVCQPILIKKLYKRILQGAIGKDGTSRYGLKFLTLTFAGADERHRIKEMIEKHNNELFKKPDKNRPYDHERKVEKKLVYPEVVYDIMTKNFHKLIRALKKQYGDFYYFRVNELQKDETPHFHVLLAGNAVIPKGILEAVRAVLKMQPNPRFENVCS